MGDDKGWGIPSTIFADQWGCFIPSISNFNMIETTRGVGVFQYKVSEVQHDLTVCLDDDFINALSAVGVVVGVVG